MTRFQFLLQKLNSIMCVNNYPLYRYSSSKIENACMLPMYLKVCIALKLIFMPLQISLYIYLNVNILLNKLTATLANQRPTHLVAFINPNSGKRTAEKIFKNKVLPLLRLCNIGCNAYVTQYPKQAREKLQIIDLQHADG